MNKTLLLIPAIKKNAIIPDQLIKKLNGITLIQRAINTAKDIVPEKNILILTDSEEISLICSRNNISCYYDTALKPNPENILNDIKNIIIKYINEYENVIFYRANAPLVTSEEILGAYEIFLKNKSKVLISVKKDSRNIYRYVNEDFCLIRDITKDEFFEEIKAFKIFSLKNIFEDKEAQLPYVLPYEKSIEIQSYQDWWVCEKILQQKRIIFNVIGSNTLGMGHIFRSLSLAHEITDHEIIFICDEKYEMAVEKIALMDYKVISTSDVTKGILELKPDLVINDILDTELEYINDLKEKNIKVVNFEDLGLGTQKSDLVINELYDFPKLEGSNFLWGYEYYFLRDEFEDAKPHKFEKEVDSALISFGGTDQNNLTLVTLKLIIDIAFQNDIRIYIVCGAGYLYKKELEDYLVKHENKNIELTFAVGVISKIMEKTQIAFSSNGRTVYELADMNITSVIISHHERENTHRFATLEKGFINLGIYNEETTKDLIITSFKKLIVDIDYRKLLFLNINKYSFRNNKKKVVKKILELI